MWKNQKGFSLIEVIITIAILGVLAGSAVALFGHISYANTKKVVEEVDSALSRLRLDTMTTMSQDEPQYLYIYQMDDGYYMKLLNDLEENTSSYLYNLVGTRLCGNNVTFKNDDGVYVAKGKCVLCVAYKKNGQLKDVKPQYGGTTKITITGNGTYTIILDSATGKHYFE